MWGSLKGIVLNKLNILNLFKCVWSQTLHHIGLLYISSLFSLKFARRRMVGVNQDDRSLEEGDVLGDNSDVEDSQMSQGLVEEELMQEEVEQDERTPGGSDCDEDDEEDDINKEKKKNDPYTQEKMEAEAKLLYSENESDLLEPVKYFRKMLSVCNPPISEFIDLNILPRFVQLLSCTKDPVLRVGLLGCYRMLYV